MGKELKKMKRATKKQLKKKEKKTKRDELKIVEKKTKISFSNVFVCFF